MFCYSVYQVISVPELLPSPQETRVLSKSRSVSSGTDLFSGDSWRVRVLASLAYCYQRSDTFSAAHHKSMSLYSLSSSHHVEQPKCSDLIRLPPPRHHLFSAPGILMSTVCGIPLVTRRTESEAREELRLSIHHLFPTIVTMTDLCHACNPSSGESSVSAPICLAAGDLSSGEPCLSSTFVPSHSTGSPTTLSLSGMILRSATAIRQWASTASRSLNNWAWPSLRGATSSPYLKNPRPNVPKNLKQYFVKMVVLASSKISGGFTGVSISSTMLYFSTRKNLLVDSPGLILFPCLIFMNGDVSSGLFSSACFNLFTCFSPCVAVCTGPEGAIETTSVFLVGESWLSTSLVTIFQPSDSVVKVLSTHLSFVLNSLSTSYEDLSCFISFAVVAYVSFPRGCLIPSCLCNL